MGYLRLNLFRDCGGFTKKNKWSNIFLKFKFGFDFMRNLSLHFIENKQDEILVSFAIKK